MQDKLQQFREQVYQNFNKQKQTNTLMNIVDALSSNQSAKSVVELTLNPLFSRSYSTLSKAISVESISNEELAYLASQTIEPEQKRKFYLLGIDVTSNPRPYAETMADRGFVYQPNTIKGNKPIAIGHQYSLAAFLPEYVQKNKHSWVVPMSMDRIGSQEDKEGVGSQQIRALLEDESLPFSQNLCVEVADSAYSKPVILHTNYDKENLITITRSRGTRTFYRQPEPEAEPKKEVGHPNWFGTPFRLKDPQTWGEPDECVETSYTSQRGKTYRVEIQSWRDLVMHGKKGIPMHQQPFTLVKICWYRPDGQPLYQKPLWLIVMGVRRDEISALETYQSYLQRFNLEHFFRFGKQKLLLDKFQTPDVQHEENWWRLVSLAYLQLWVAKDLVYLLPRPWERCLPSFLNKTVSPAMVLRDMSRIICQIGTPASVPKPRGNSPGRKKGASLTPRMRFPPVKKAI